MSDNPSKFSTKFEKLQIEREDETLNSSGDTAFDESKKESTNITKESNKLINLLFSFFVNK